MKKRRVDFEKALAKISPDLFAELLINASKHPAVAQLVETCIYCTWEFSKDLTAKILSFAIVPKGPALRPHR